MLLVNILRKKDLVVKVDQLKKVYLKNFDLIRQSNKSLENIKMKVDGICCNILTSHITLNIDFPQEPTNHQ